MKTNETILIKDSSKRLLTAKGYKFLEKCRDTACKVYGFHRFSAEMKDINNRLGILIISLIIDKRLNENQIIEIINNSVKLKETIN